MCVCVCGIRWDSAEINLNLGKEITLSPSDAAIPQYVTNYILCFKLLILFQYLRYGNAGILCLNGVVSGK